MIEVGLRSLSLCCVLAAFGAFDFGLRISDWMSKKKWYWILIVIVCMVLGFFVFERIYGKWIILA